MASPPDAPNPPSPSPSPSFTANLNANYNHNHNHHTTSEHLCVLIHGLWGNPGHLSYIHNALRARYSERELRILAVRRNAGNFTYDGIETGGERVAREIEDAIEEYACEGVRIEKLSVVGYSLGGLVARYAIGILYSKGYFDRIKPVNFTTFATPHLGVRTPLRGYHNHIWNVIGARSLSASGRQLFMIDTFRTSNRPLLAVLAEPHSVFYRALSLFAHRTLYVNVVNDRSTCFYTAGISHVDPFANPAAVAPNYLPHYSPIVMDPDRPVVSTRATGAGAAAGTGTGERLLTLLARLPVSVLYTFVIIPLGLMLFAANATVQSVFSSRRIRAHVAEEHGYHRLPLWAEHLLQEAADPHPAPEHEQEEEEQEPEPGKKHRALLEAAGAPAGPTLALAPAQFAMVWHLNQLAWRKFPVWIHADRHSHAAIIVRNPKPWRWEEGTEVVRHWLEREFVVREERAGERAGAREVDAEEKRG